jgi:GTP pyrophosphokinase
MMNPPVVAAHNLKSLFQAARKMTPTEVSLIERAYQRAEKAHAGQVRRSGDPYFTHCVEVAHIVAEMGLDADTIVAALLHDVLEDCEGITLDDLRAEFGETVATIVDGVTKLKNLPVSKETDKRKRSANKEIEYIRKMLMAMGEDVRVVIVKLADRLHNMRTLGFMPEDKQMRIARETLEIFAPLANRLGIWRLKWELEDLSFRYLDPQAYRSLAQQVAEQQREREQYMKGVIRILRSELARQGIRDATISGRPKHLYSIHKKMIRKGIPFDQVYDVRAVRVIVDTVQQCYQALGIVHTKWRPIPGEFDDYIADPKENFYKSLHTAVRDPDGKTLEIQIRTRAMHEDAEYGVAAHWRYKEGRNPAHDEVYEQRITWLRRLLEVGHDGGEDSDEFMENMKTDVFKDRVYAVTPKGDVIDLPAGATPIDFAYHIHTDLGHRCRGARVNGQLISLNHVLKTGDQVEIMTTKQGGPSLDWLNPDLGYVNTARARQKIKYWFRKQHRERNLAAGRDMLERELKKLGLSSLPLEQVAGYFSFSKVDDFLVSIGAGDVTGPQISRKVLEIERAALTAHETQEVPIKPAPMPLVVDAANGVSIQGLGGMLVNLAKCCNPVPGDSIVGYITRGRGVSVHRLDCPNIVHMPDYERERQLDVAWGTIHKEQSYAVPVEIIAYDRDGLLRDLTTVIADDHVNISKVNVDTRQDIASIQLTLQIASMDQLSRILSRIERISSVVEARRRSAWG